MKELKFCAEVRNFWTESAVLPQQIKELEEERNSFLQAFQLSEMTPGDIRLKHMQQPFSLHRSSSFHLRNF